MAQTRRQRLTEAIECLSATGVPDARLDAEWLLAAASGMKRLPMLMALDVLLSDDEAALFGQMVSRRALREPLQYIIGSEDFMGRAFRTDARALIPRADTETLCAEAILRLRPGMRALDIGTGTGALAVSMALACPGVSVTAVDISADALALAQENAGALGAQIRFIQSDLFAALDGETFDVIISNPPYIPAGELSGLQREVRFEPALALHGGADGLDFYRRIMLALPGHMLRGGALLFEVGDGQAADVSALMAPHFDAVRTAKDLSGLCRAVMGDGYAG